MTQAPKASGEKLGQFGEAFVGGYLAWAEKHRLPFQQETVRRMHVDEQLENRILVHSQADQKQRSIEEVARICKARHELPASS
jgi:hypothetical protein